MPQANIYPPIALAYPPFTPPLNSIISPVHGRTQDFLHPSYGTAYLLIFRHPPPWLISAAETKNTPAPPIISRHFAVTIHNIDFASN